jgi:pyruvate/2-oxoglutarate dehydrogenase complex dihydrolipoamide dehydrogenase (E3) component
VREVIAGIAPHDSIERYTALGVEVIEGYARLVDPWTVEITGKDGTTQRLTGRAIVIAAGAAPFVPPLPGLGAVGYLTSDTLWDDFSGRDTIPKRITVLGGGPIGCELAQSLARLGAEVTQVELAERVLLREDPEVSALAASALEKAGVRLLTSHKAVRCEARGSEKLLVTEIGGLTREIAFDVLIVAVGRAARLTGYGLETLGIPTNRVVETNEYLETLYPNIFAAGDVAGPYQLTHAAGHQGWHAAVNALFGTFKKFAVDWSALPAVTFLDPEIARVGLNESEAKARSIAYEVTTYALDDLDRAIAEGETEGFVKVITAKGTDRILGATVVGAHAGEILAEFTLAIRHKLGLNKVLAAIHPYPTFSEANKYAAGVWKKAHAPETVLRLLQRYHAFRRGEGWR